MTNTVKTILSALVLTIAIISAPTAFADEDLLPATAQEKPDNSVQPSELAKKESEALYNAIEKLMSDKSEEQQAHFTALYQSSNIASVVKTVRYDVGQAVETCVENQPESTGEMSKTFETWTSAINESLEKIESRVNNMIIVQDYAEPQKITTIINQANQLRAKTNSALKKQPITTLEACENLHKSLAKSKSSLTKMVDDVLLAIPRIQAKENDAAPQQDSE